MNYESLREWLSPWGEIFYAHHGSGGGFPQP